MFTNQAQVVASGLLAAGEQRVCRSYCKPSLGVVHFFPTAEALGPRVGVRGRTPLRKRIFTLARLSRPRRRRGAGAWLEPLNRSAPELCTHLPRGAEQQYKGCCARFKGCISSRLEGELRVEVCALQQPWPARACN